MENNQEEIRKRQEELKNQPRPILVNRKEEFEGEFQKRYFTPSIEDIRVGYECEFLSGRGMETIDNWRNCRIEQWHLPIAIRDIKLIRVPYLTKEQIEKEGWESEGTIGSYKKGRCKALHGIISDATRVQHYLSIVEGDSFFVRYAGECKDINTFRYICKLLNI